MINRQFYCVYDFETGGKNPHTCEPIQIAAYMLNGRTLDLVEGSNFNSYMKPTDFDSLEEEALNINNITREQLMEAPEQADVWSKFVAYLKKYELNAWPKKPIPCGFNIDGYDSIIIERLCEKYGQIDKKRGHQNIFDIGSYDVLKDVKMWFENSNDLDNYKLSTVLDFCEIENTKAHDALADVIATAKLAQKFIRLRRNVFSQIKWKKNA